MQRRARSVSAYRRGLRLATGAGALMLTVGACIIEERKFDERLAGCAEYCSEVASACPDPYKVYDRPDACMAVCLLMEPGNSFGGSNRNTVACRLEKLREVDFEAATGCPQVGPGGNGECGTDCDALCALREQVCSDIPGQANQIDRAECLRNCAALPDDATFNATRDRGGDSLQCRLVYISEAAVSRELAAERCAHTQVIPEAGETVPCSDPQELPKEQDCQKYCGLVMGACEEGFAPYQSKEQCVSVCRILDQGQRGDTTLNSVRCRRYHSYAALGNEREHCTHAGPTGDGHCGADNCNAYCRIAQQGCPTAFAAQFPTDTDTNWASCEASCAALPGAAANAFRDSEQRYTVNPPPVGNTLMCRTFRAVTALAGQDDPGQCAAAFGVLGSECR